MAQLSRRKFIGNLSLLLGTSLSPFGIRALAASSTYLSDSKKRFLTSDQRLMLSTIADIIIPDTDTPGAQKARVPEYIEHMLFNLLSKQDSEKWLFEFNTFNNKVGGFNHLSARLQLNAVTRLDDNLGSDNFYKKLKELTVIGYYTSEIGASIELQYDPVPGPYQEMPLAVIGRAWS